MKGGGESVSFVLLMYFVLWQAGLFCQTTSKGEGSPLSGELSWGQKTHLQGPGLIVSRGQGPGRLGDKCPAPPEWGSRCVCLDATVNSCQKRVATQ